MLFVFKDDNMVLKFNFGSDIDRETKWEHFHLQNSLRDVIELHKMLITRLAKVRCRIETTNLNKSTPWLSVRKLFIKYGFKSSTSLNLDIFRTYKFKDPIPLANSPDDVYSHILIEIFSLYCYEHFKYKYYAVEKDLYDMETGKKIEDTVIYNAVRNPHDFYLFKSCQIGKTLSVYLNLVPRQSNVMCYTSYKGD